jgi:hypothetical protein
MSLSNAALVGLDSDALVGREARRSLEEAVVELGRDVPSALHTGTGFTRSTADPWERSMSQKWPKGIAPALFMSS